ncbi:hypothetical protein HMPREF9056_02829 [Actinomyces sp. oral taxon 170 str. F0386]|nr:hypothetical protein HMPREF9056_02829 [Actinomyces sp. oral taxon 170 str. F0386]
MLFLVGDVLVPRGLRLPADHWGLTVVVCGKGTSSMYAADRA